VTCRILHIIDSLERQGAAGQLVLMATGLPSDAFKSHVVSLAGPGPHSETLARAGIEVSSLGRRWSFDPLAFGRLCGLIRRWQPDVVHAWTPAARDYAAMAARLIGIKSLVLAWRSVDRATPVWRQRWVARQSRAVVVNCAAMRHECRMLNLPDETIRLIHNAVAVPSPACASRRQLLDRIPQIAPGGNGQNDEPAPLSDSVRLIAAAGPLVRDRHVKDLIWAADLLKVIRNDVHLLIFGDGPQRECLELFREQVEIADRVHFLGDAADLPDWLPHVDLFWSARHTTGTPNAVLEAMAAGLPVVACDAPGMRELVSNERTGYLVRAGHRAGLTQWADYILNHPEHAQKLGEAGRARALAEFSVESMVEAYAESYRTL
jgi:glycosyltransferase involved in cell wall biosynthesis